MKSPSAPHAFIYLGFKVTGREPEYVISAHLLSQSGSQIATFVMLAANAGVASSKGFAAMVKREIVAIIASVITGLDSRTS